MEGGEPDGKAPPSRKVKPKLGKPRHPRRPKFRPGVKFKPRARAQKTPKPSSGADGIFLPGARPTAPSAASFSAGASEKTPDTKVGKEAVKLEKPAASSKLANTPAPPATSTTATKIPEAAEQKQAAVSHVQKVERGATAPQVPIFTPNEQKKRRGILAGKWDLLPDILKVRGLVKQHINSFNYFVTQGLQDIINANKEIRSELNSGFFLRYKSIHVGKPSLEEDSYTVNTKITPMMCRVRDLTYSAPIEVQVVYTQGKKLRESKVCIGRMPIMLQSCKCMLADADDDALAKMQECPFDPGGYFVVRGFEKVVLIQEQLRNNRIMVNPDDKGILAASVVSATHERKSRTMVTQKKGRFYVQHNKFTHEIPFAIMMKAMGVTSDQAVVSLVGTDPIICARMALSLQHAATLKVFTQEQALHLIGGLIKAGGFNFRRRRTREDEARNVLENVVLVHMAGEANHSFQKKAMYLALMVHRIICAERDPRLISDKDYYGNKRLELAGGLMALLFEDLFKNFNSNIKRYVDKVFSKPNRAADFNVLSSLSQWQDVITNGMISSIGSGNWILKRFRMEQKGVTETVTRLSYMAALGHMTRVRSNVEKSRKVSGPRALQGSQWGMVCPADTPEGEQCGLVKSLALLAHVTVNEDDSGIERLLFNLGVEDVMTLAGEEMFAKGTYLVALNGRIIGATNRATALVFNLRQLRRRGKIGEFVSFYIHTLKHTVNVSTDGGRVCRPLIIVDQHTRQPRLEQRHYDELVQGVRDFQSLLREGCLEYVDVNEENSCNIALYADQIHALTTHVEIEPVTIMGVVSALIPFPHHNQSPRNTYQCAMGKQAIGSIGLNQLERCNLNPLLMMVYPHKPMVRSRVLEFVNFDRLGAGQNAMLAVMSYSGYDIEDAVVLNKSSLDRGYGRVVVVKRYTTVIKKHQNRTMDRVDPPPEKPVGMSAAIWAKRNTRYQCLGADGVAEVGTAIHKNHVMLNRMVPENTTDNISDPSMIGYRSQPVIYKEPGRGTINKVILTTGGTTNEKIVKVLVRDCRRPELGDKFASRHGQKGVVGLIVPQENLPFNEQGICPDMIMNPHGFPSRMTVGKMIELVGGKAGLHDGKQRYGTCFGGDNVQDCGQVLVEHGFHYSGKEMLYSGLTGEIYKAYIFFGPIYYQRLKHMVKDKMFARARGPHVVLTRQPTQGRAREGGLRVGEMERDCLVAHGVSLLLVERMLLSSDPFTASVCSKCGILAYTGYCQYCKKGGTVADFRIPYACKLLFQELMSMNVQPRIRLAEGGFYDKCSTAGQL